MKPITGVKVFTATRAREREDLGDAVTRWLAAHPDVEVVQSEVRQSSDAQFHCLTCVLFYRAVA
jgi:hypothetical protein